MVRSSVLRCRLGDYLVANSFSGLEAHVTVPGQVSERLHASVGKIHHESALTVNLGLLDLEKFADFLDDPPSSWFG